MKKAVVGFFVLLLGVSVQAAALTWGGYGYSGDPALDASWYTGGQAYLLLVTDGNPANFGVSVVGGVLTLTDATIVDSTGVVGGSASKLLTTTMSAGAHNYYALLMTTAGTGITLPTTGLYGVSPTGQSTPWNTDTGGIWAMDTSFNSGNGVDVSTPVGVPEPASMALFGIGAGVLALRRRFQKKA